MAGAGIPMAVKWPLIMFEVNAGMFLNFWGQFSTFLIYLIIFEYCLIDKNQYFQKIQLKELHKTLPKPHEAALALLNKDVKYDFVNFKKDGIEPISFLDANNNGSLPL